MLRRLALPFFVVAVLCLSIVTPQVSWGQKPPPPTPPNPQAPVLNPVMPAGIQRGTTLELVLTGTNLAGPTGFYTSFPAKVTIPAEDKNGTDNAKLKVLLEVPGDAPIGPHLIRLATSRGMSNLRVFCVDELPQVIEDDKNRDKKTPQAAATPCVVVGKADNEQSDWFKITVAAGQRLGFDVLSRRLGSSMDPQISIYDAKTGRELAHDNDSPGCQGDPRLTVLFKEAGDYLIEVRDVLHRGGADYFYRMRIGDFPLASVPIPMAGKRGEKVRVEFAGPSVEGVSPVEVAVPSDPAIPAVWVAPKAAGATGWPVMLAASDVPEATEVEPNNEPGKAQRLAMPSGVTGRMMPSNDSDFYVFSAKKGQKVRIEVETLEFYSPTLVYFIIKNAKGADLAKSNPQSPPPADQRLEFTAPEDGDFMIEVQHLNFVGGPTEAYHLTIVPSAPGFDALMTLERFDVSAGSIAPLPITINRKGYTGPIDLEVIGGGGLTGKGTVKAGQASAVLVVMAKADMPVGPQTLVIMARAVVDKQPVAQLVSMKLPVSQSLANLSYPPVPWLYELAIAVKEKAPFALEITADPPEAAPGLPVGVKVSVVRDPGFEEPIELNPPVGLPPGVPPIKLGPIAKDKNEATFKLNLDAKVPVGEYQILVSAKSKFMGKDISASTPPLNLMVGMPFDLKVEPATITLNPGDKEKLKVSAVRKGGYKGPITLELRKLPPGVTAGKATLNADQETVEVEIAAAPTAAPAEVKDADVLGTATGLANLQNASPVLTIRVEKK